MYIIYVYGLHKYMNKTLKKYRIVKYKGSSCISLISIRWLYFENGMG